MQPHNITIAKLRKWFFSGLMILLPIVLTMYALITIIEIVDGIITSALAVFLPRTMLESMHGLGLILAFVFTIAFGALMSNFLGIYFRKLGGAMIKKVPIVNSLYSTIKQLIDTIVSNKSKSFASVVLLEYPKKDSWVLGFVTSESDFFAEALKEKEGILHVFVPTTPNPTSGFLLIVPKSQTKETSLTTQEAMKFIISAGAVDLETMEKKITNGNNAKGKSRKAEYHKMTPKKVANHKEANHEVANHKAEKQEIEE